MLKDKINKSKSGVGVLITTAFKSVLFSFKYLPVFTVLALIFSTLYYVFDFARDFVYSKIVDSIVSSSKIGLMQNDLLFWFILLISTYFVNSLINQIDRTSAVIYFGRFDRLVDSLLANKLSSLDISYFEDSSTNKLIQKVRQNGHRLRGYVYNLVDLVGIIASLVVAGVIVYKLSPIIFFILLISYLPYSFSEFKFGRSLWGIWDTKGETRMHVRQIDGYLTNEKNIPEVRVFGIKDYLLNIYNNFYRVFIDEQIAVEKKKTVFRAIFDLIGTASFAYAYYVIIQKTVSGDISLGLATFYIGAISKMWSHVSRFFGGISKLYEDNLYIKDFFELMSFENKIISGQKVLENGEGIKIEFNHVCFKYSKSKRYVFKDFNLVINPKERIALVGENGAGKTTLMKLLLRFYDVSSGEILINGVNIKEYDLQSYYKNFAALQQEFVKYHFDAKTNIGLGNLENIEDKNLIQKSSRLSGADLFIQKLENKYDQILSKHFEGGTELSTGQWQKIALARAFFKNSPILILDEPTSAIDPKAEYKIFEKLFDFAKEKTVLIISHRFSTVRNANRILVLDGGKIVEEGTHKELLDKNGMYKEAYDLQKKGYEDA